mmetsp:Transcript_8407/g.11603  ORF Transcript_8407/g.11603 Transcript_8407/m.11603 type:complete len:128 (+) Transcript_8407:1446-1829(+)
MNMFQAPDAVSEHNAPIGGVSSGLRSHRVMTATNHDMKGHGFAGARAGLNAHNKKSTQEEAIESLRQYLPDSTVDYLQKRHKRRSQPFFDYIGNQVYTREKAKKEAEEDAKKQAKNKGGEEEETARL